MEDDQQFCLRWNNHQSTLVSVFDTLLENGTLVDCTLAAEGQFINAHKVVLSACSPYFAALLSQHYDKHPVFILKDVKYQELKAMMDYMYRGEVNISQDQLGALLKAAESLQIKGLSDNKKGGSGSSGDESKSSVKGTSASSKSEKGQGLTIEQRRKEMIEENSRDGSQSPRRRKRPRRRSVEEMDNHHDASNSSESHHSNIPNVVGLAAVGKSTAAAGADVDDVRQSKVASSADEQVPILTEKLEVTDTMIEPKAEYDEGNDDSIEDLTLDDDEMSNMDQMGDEGAGPSHGNMGEGSAQDPAGYTLFPPDSFNIEPLVEHLSPSFRKYSRERVMSAIDAILNHGASVTSASLAYGIKRTSLHLYLKKLNIRKNKVRATRKVSPKMIGNYMTGIGGGALGDGGNVNSGGGGGGGDGLHVGLDADDGGAHHHLADANIRDDPSEPDCVLGTAADVSYYDDEDDELVDQKPSFQ